MWRAISTHRVNTTSENSNMFTRQKEKENKEKHNDHASCSLQKECKSSVQEQCVLQPARIERAGCVKEYTA